MLYPNLYRPRQYTESYHTMFHIRPRDNPHPVNPDPMEWSVDHVQQWLNWAEKEFAFSPIERSALKLTGAQLCSLTPEEFLKRAPAYTGDVLLSHFNLLRARGGNGLVMCGDNNGVLSVIGHCTGKWEALTWGKIVAQFLGNCPGSQCPF